MSIDLHSHLLPGLDDGAATIQESIELARELARAGVTIVAATPHVRDDYPTAPATMLDGVAAVRQALADASVALDVVAGGEISLEQLALLDADALDSFSFGGKYVLLEFPFDSWPAELADGVDNLSRAGFTTILAHPERNPVVQVAPQRLAGLVGAGALVQLTAGSLVGAFGRESTAAAHSLLDSGLAHLVAGDAHHPGTRPTIATISGVISPELTTWLTSEVPSAILAGERPSAPPPSRRKRRLFAR